MASSECREALPLRKAKDVPHSCPAEAASTGCKEEEPWGTPGTHKPPTAHGTAPPAPLQLFRREHPQSRAEAVSLPEPSLCSLSLHQDALQVPPGWLARTLAGRVASSGGLRRVWPCSHSHLRGTPLQAPSPTNVSGVPALRVGPLLLWPSWLLPMQPGGHLPAAWGAWPPRGVGFITTRAADRPSLPRHPCEPGCHFPAGRSCFATHPRARLIPTEDLSVFSSWGSTSALQISLEPQEPLLAWTSAQGRPRGPGSAGAPRRGLLGPSPSPCSPLPAPRPPRLWGEHL